MVSFCPIPFMKGGSIGLGLIMGIGPQNAFILKQGILRNHVHTCVILCILFDSLMIYLGVSKLGYYITCNPYLLEIARWGGAAFLGYYGFKSLKAVFKMSSSSMAETADIYRPSLKEVILTLFTVSFLNPYMYIDTVVLLGTIGAQFDDMERPFFALGAVLSSAIWFCALGYGARLLSPLFKKPMAWKILELLTCLIMWTIAALLIFKM